MTESSFGLHGTPPSQKRRGWVLALGLVGVILVGNAVVFYFYKQNREEPFAAAVTDVPDEPRDPAAIRSREVVAPARDEGRAAESGKHARAEEQRAKGIELLRGGDYAGALTALQSAKGLHPDLENVDDLIEVARKLRRGARRTPEDAPVARAAPGSTRRSAAATRTSPVRAGRRLGRRQKPALPSDTARPARPAATKPAIILVTTKPERMVVRVDGEARDMSPARIEVDPGRHRVEIVDGENTLLSETVTVESGDVELINRAFEVERPATAAVTEPRSEPAPGVGISRDRELNLVELLDRDDVSGSEPAGRTESAAVAPVVEDVSERAARPANPRRSDSPRVLLYFPGRNADRVRSELAQGLSGIEVALVGSETRLRRELASGADAVVASSFVLRQMGLAPSLVAEGGGDYALASFSQGMTPGQAAGGSVAVLDELGRKGTPPFVARLLGVSSPPLLRRVNKVEDLLTLLQLGQADAIIVRPRHLASLRGRTQRTLHSIGLRAPSVALAVAFVDGGRRNTIEPRIKNLPGEARAELGITRWASR